MITTKLKGIWIPAKIILNKNLTTTEKLVLSIILYLSEKQKYCFASNKYIGEIINVTSGRISKVVSKLKEKCYIKVKLNYKNGSKEVESRAIIPIVENNNTYSSKV